MVLGTDGLPGTVWLCAIWRSLVKVKQAVKQSLITDKRGRPLWSRDIATNEQQFWSLRYDLKRQLFVFERAVNQRRVDAAATVH